MKKIALIIINLILCSILSAQVVNLQYFPKDNEIDIQYEKESKNAKTISELDAVTVKYLEIWDKQMNNEMNRLIDLLPAQKEEIEENHALWLNLKKEDNLFINRNLNLNKVGKQPLVEYKIEMMKLYRERAVYYFCLYYSIKEQMEKNFSYKEKRELAKDNASNPNVEYLWFKDLGQIKANPKDNKNTVIYVTVYLAFDEQNIEVISLVDKNKNKIRKLIQEYISSKTTDNLKNVYYEEVMIQELKDIINEKLFDSEIIETVYFDELDIVEKNSDSYY